MSILYIAWYNYGQMYADTLMIVEYLIPET